MRHFNKKPQVSYLRLLLQIGSVSARRQYECRRTSGWVNQLIIYFECINSTQRDRNPFPLKVMLKSQLLSMIPEPFAVSFIFRHYGAYHIPEIL